MRQEKGDDSERESDWFDRTGINPAEYTKSNKKVKHANKSTHTTTFTNAWTMMLKTSFVMLKTMRTKTLNGE